jgi:hypothetical protein
MPPILQSGMAATNSKAKSKAHDCQYFIFTATAQTGAADARGLVDLCHSGRDTNRARYEDVIFSGKTFRENASHPAGKGSDMTYAQDNTLRAGIAQGVSYLALIAVGLAALLFGAWKWDTGRTNQTVEQSDDALVRDIATQLPAGTPRADIQKFLMERGMPQPGYFNFGGPSPIVEGATAILYTRTPPVGNMVHSCWVQFYFRLDGSDTLTGYTHEARCTSYLMDGNKDQGTPLLR